MVKLSLSRRPLFATLALLAFPIPATAASAEGEGCRPLVRQLIDAAIRTERAPRGRPNWRAKDRTDEDDGARQGLAPATEASSAPAETAKK